MSHQLFEEKEHTTKYRLHRPGYPKQLFEYIIDYYHNQNKTNEKIPLALDVGCGNGQATCELSPFCHRVIGIDISANQIANAIQKHNIEYRCNKAEDLSFLETNSVDLITIATTLHWLDIELFIKEVKRVLKKTTGVFAVWTYGIGALDNPKADALYNEFNQITLFPYWNSKRWLVDDYYQSLLPLLPYKSTLNEYTIEQRIDATIKQFIGFIETLSACQTYKKQEGEQAYENLIENFREKLILCYEKHPNKNNPEEIIDLNQIKLTVFNSIRLYLMRKE